jgi:hypothetical protein
VQYPWQMPEYSNKTGLCRIYKSFYVLVQFGIRTLVKGSSWSLSCGSPNTWNVINWQLSAVSALIRPTHSYILPILAYPPNSSHFR